MTTADGWDPGQYERFKDERSAPFWDLAALVQPVAQGRVVDLGCGTGELTAQLHRRLGAGETLGVDNSAAMLERSAPFAGDGVRFAPADIATVPNDDVPAGGFDVVFSNAALQWVPDHHHTLAAWTRLLRPGGQLAVQVPANVDHPSHTTSAAVALESPFIEAMGGAPPPDPVLSVLRPEDYATLLDELGFTTQHVRLQVYGHRLASTAEVVEWVKGTSLTRFRTALGDELFEAFVERYRQRLVETVGMHRPYFYPFKRVLLWGRLP